MNTQFKKVDHMPLSPVSFEDIYRVRINQNYDIFGDSLAKGKTHICGYQVLDKWLKERKKHEITLSSEDYQHFIKVVNVLDYTIKTMEKIDELTREWV